MIDPHIAWTPDTLDAARFRGDRPADQLLDALTLSDPSGASTARVLDGIIREPGLPDDLPPAVMAFIDDHVDLPEWADPDLLAEAAEFFESYGWTTFCILALASLPEGYSVGDVDRVLAATQELEHHVHRRLWETMQFTLDVMSGEGVRGTAGRRSVLKVRLLHASVRHLIQLDPADVDESGVSGTGLSGALAATRWDPSRGVPISQSQMAGTVLAFGWVTLRGLRQLGYAPTAREEQAYLHAWNVVGALLGVDEDLMAWSFDDGWWLFHGIRDPQIEATPEGRRLTAALVGFFHGGPKWLGFMRPLPKMLIWYFVGEEVAATIGVELTRRQRRWLHPLMLVMLRWGQAQNTLMREVAPARLGSRWIFRQLSRSFIGHPRGGRRGAFTLDPELARRWTARRHVPRRRRAAVT